MRLPWLTITVLMVAHIAGCSSRVVQTAFLPDTVHGDAAPSGSTQAYCGSTLAERIAVTTIDVDADIRYKREGYDRIPTDARLAFSVAPTGNGYVAWSDNALENVHVTPLSALQTRLGDDVILPGADVAGLVAQPDGFSLLVNRTDPGTTLVNPNPADDPPGRAVVVVRSTGTQIAFEAALTGTSAITYDASNPTYDCSPEQLDGRLVFTDNRYAAYFTVHGCKLGSETYQHTSYYADKLAYLDDRGQSLSGGWDWGCEIAHDLRIFPTSGPSIALCMSDRIPAPGLNLMSNGFNPTLLAAEYAKQGFTSGQFGSLVKLGDGSYVLVWLSRGAPAPDATHPPRPTNDIALLQLTASPDYTPTANPTWVTDTADVNETNLHAIAYGPDEILVIWDSVEQLDCDRSANNATCFGRYAGTHFRLMNARGQFTTPDSVLPYPPNGRDDLATFPNGDVGWAFVPDDARTYNGTLPMDSARIPDVSPKRQINLVRLLLCH
jgi:hypothetical protein